MKKRNGFTLVELLAVIVILAIILVIAVPQIMNTITSARGGSLESTAKLIASSAETYYLTETTLGHTVSTINCASVATLPDGITGGEGGNCTINMNDGIATVTITSIGSGQFNGCGVSSATKESATITGSNCGAASGAET